MSAPLDIATAPIILLTVTYPSWRDPFVSGLASVFCLGVGLVAYFKRGGGCSRG